MCKMQLWKFIFTLGFLYLCANAERKDVISDEDIENAIDEYLHDKDEDPAFERKHEEEVLEDYLEQVYQKEKETEEQEEDNDEKTSAIVEVGGHTDDEDDDDLIGFNELSERRDAYVQDSSNNLREWMKSIPSYIKLSQIAVPGTHDTAAYRVPGNIGETQDWSPKTQLDNGIRFFDIRLSNSYRYKNDFELRHNKLKLGSFSNLVMKPLREFLSKHKYEVVFMSIKGEGGDLDIHTLEKLYLSKPEFYHRAVTKDTTLKSVRGKIVVIRRYKYVKLNLGFRWDKNIKNIVDFQDSHKLSMKKSKKCWKVWFKRVCHGWIPKGIDYNKKARLVTNFLGKAAANYGKKFFINFASAHFNGAYIGNSAKVSNNAVLKYFKSHKYTKIGCIIPMDYPNRVKGLIQEIINNNKNRKPKICIPSGGFGSSRRRRCIRISIPRVRIPIGSRRRRVTGK